MRFNAGFKEWSLHVLLHRITRVMISFLIITTAMTAFATLEYDQERLEKEIISLMRNKAGSSPKNSINFQYSENIPLEQRVGLLRKLAFTLNKVKYPNQIPHLTKILITDDRKESSFDYFHGDTTLALSTQHKNHPWVSILSWDHLHEDPIIFVDDQSILRVEVIRYFPPTGIENESPVTEVSRLPFKPYSSSYLSLRNGDILERPREQGLGNEFDNVFNKKINEKYIGGSPIERFDFVRQNKLGSPTSLLTQEFLKQIHNPKAQYWEGYCNQWSAGSLDPQVNQFISSTKGVICDSIFISEGELKELFTLFYSTYTPKFVAGSRTRVDFNENSDWLRSNLGLDDLAAHDFHNNVHRYLKRGKGIVIEVSANSEIWNQPLYQATSTSTHVSQTPANLTKMAPLIPADLLESDQINDKGILEEYQKIESDLRDIMQGEVAIESSKDLWLGKTTNVVKTAFKRPISELMMRRSEIFVNYILPSMNEGHLKLKKGITSHYVNSEIEYGSETSFAREGHNSHNRTYMYLLFKKGDQIIDGRWITEPDLRPDFLWVPENNRDALIGRKELSPEAEDLLRLSKYCKKASDVFSLFALVRKAVSDGTITPTEKKEISKSYSEVSKFVNTESLQNLFKQQKLRGVDVSDIFVPSE